ncbi:hypothetical protein AGLY_012586 [Aphis glycines]|uniref:Uncharacterized protein n=1 Tax=Aphis glycines TaxID=307491 RepID=A0A6G0T8S4_APHGL|nr:hypothetical protein AGLY_012586 [Aphis glycines]
MPMTIFINNYTNTLQIVTYWQINNNEFIHMKMYDVIIILKWRLNHNSYCKIMVPKINNIFSSILLSVILNTLTIKTLKIIEVLNCKLLTKRENFLVHLFFSVYSKLQLISISQNIFASIPTFFQLNHSKIISLFLVGIHNIMIVFQCKINYYLKEKIALTFYAFLVYILLVISSTPPGYRLCSISRCMTFSTLRLSTHFKSFILLIFLLFNTILVSGSSSFIVVSKIVVGIGNESELPTKGSPPPCNKNSLFNIRSLQAAVSASMPGWSSDLVSSSVPGIVVDDYYYSCYYHDNLVLDHYHFQNPKIIRVKLNMKYIFFLLCNSVVTNNYNLNNLEQNILLLSCSHTIIKLRNRIYKMFCPFNM